MSVQPTPQHQPQELAGSVTVRFPRRVIRVETEGGVMSLSFEFCRS